ncbi:MAG: RadC family protein [Clostridia bacterium]|nr:RadC family protein [Clostridia bacterium]
MHEGHRKRMYEKLKSGENFFEHEVLEMLLYNAYPRKNTNPIAHALLKRFPGIDAIFNASIEELCEVPDVGERVALYLKNLGECFKLVKKTECFGVVNNYDEFKKFAALRFQGEDKEVLEVYCLDKGNRIIKIYSYTVSDPVKVEVSPKELMKAFSQNTPYGVFVAHNHVNGTARPSEKDDAFTKQIQVVCSILGVEFYDHCIFAPDGSVYSYYTNGNFYGIKEQFSVWNITKK